MKKYLVVILLTFLNLSKLINAQCIDLAPLITQLNSETVWHRLDAVRDLVNCNNPEAIPALLDRFDIEQNSTVKTRLLQALDHFDYENIVSISQQFINEANNYNHYTLENKLTNKLYAVLILFKYNDYSYAYIVFEYLNVSNDVSDGSVEALDEIIENLPAYEQQAKDALINIARNADHFSPRAIAIDILSKHFGLDVGDLIIERFTTDEEYVPRFTALKNLFKLNYQNIHSLLVERITINVDEFGSLRYRIADSLLKNWGEPWDLKDVIEYSQNEPEQVYQNLINYDIRDFIPPQAGDNVTTAEMIDNLIVYVEALLNYEWILPNAQFDFYNHAKEVYNNYHERNYSTAIELCLEIIGNAEDALTNEEITMEGYKFLHYYPAYIIQRIEEEG